MRDQLRARHLLVELADSPGEALARGRKRLEADSFEQARRADVPGVRHHEQLRALVQLPEADAALVDGRRHRVHGGAGSVSIS